MKCICPGSECNSLRLWCNPYLYFQSRGIQEAKIKTGPLVFSHPNYASPYIELPDYFHDNRLLTDNFFLHWQWIYKPGIYEVSFLRDASGWEKRAMRFWNSSRAAVRSAGVFCAHRGQHSHTGISCSCWSPVRGEQIQCAVLLFCSCSFIAFLFLLAVVTKPIKSLPITLGKGTCGYSPPFPVLGCGVGCGDHLQPQPSSRVYSLFPFGSPTDALWHVGVLGLLQNPNYSQSSFLALATMSMEL